MVIDIILLCMVVAIRVTMSFSNSEYTSDNIFHSFFINQIKKNNHIVPTYEKRVIGGDNSYCYPYYFHYLLSYFPEKFLRAIDKYFGVFTDFLIALIIYLLSENSLSLKLVILYLLSPGFYMNPNSPHGFGLSPRTFCYFIWVLVFVILFYVEKPYVNSFHNNTMLLASCVIAAIGLLSSKFFIQVYFFNVIVLAAFFSIYEALYHGFITFLIALIMSFGKIIEIEKAHFTYFKWFRTYMRKHTTYGFNVNILVQYCKNLNIRSIFYELHYNNVLFRSVFLYLPMYYFLISAPITIDFEYLLTPSIFGCMLAFFLTSFWPLRAFGDAERYIRYAYPLSFIWAASSNIALSKNLIIVIECYFFVVLIISLLNFVKKKENNIFNQLLRIAEVTSENENAVVLPARQNDRYFFLNHTNHKILGFLVQLGCSNKRDEFTDNFFINYPIVNLIDNNYLNKFKPKYIILNKDHPQLIANKNLFLNSEKWKCIYETKNYFLYTS